MRPQAALLEAYREAREQEFSWGSSDCLMWASSVAMKITGRDPVAGLRGRYSSQREAMEIMVSHGWSSMRDVAASMFPEVPVSTARTGDWAVVEAGGRDSIGVVDYDRVVVRLERGMGRVPLTAASAVYRVE